MSKGAGCGARGVGARLEMQAKFLPTSDGRSTATSLLQTWNDRNDPLRLNQHKQILAARAPPRRSTGRA